MQTPSEQQQPSPYISTEHGTPLEQVYGVLDPHPPAPIQTQLLSPDEQTLDQTHALPEQHGEIQQEQYHQEQQHHIQNNVPHPSESSSAIDEENDKEKKNNNTLRQTIDQLQAYCTYLETKNTTYSSAIWLLISVMFIGLIYILFRWLQPHLLSQTS